MANAEQPNHAKAFLTKAEQYLASAEDSLAAERYAPAAGDAIHAGSGCQRRHRHFVDRVKQQGHGSRDRGQGTPSSTRKTRLGRDRRPAIRELTAAKGDVEYGTALTSAAKAEPLVRRARSLLDVAVEIVRLGR